MKDTTGRRAATGAATLLAAGLLAATPAAASAAAPASQSRAARITAGQFAESLQQAIAHERGRGAVPLSGCCVGQSTVASDGSQQAKGTLPVADRVTRRATTDLPQC